MMWGRFGAFRGEGWVEPWLGKFKEDKKPLVALIKPIQSLIKSLNLLILLILSKLTFKLYFSFILARD